MQMVRQNDYGIDRKRSAVPSLPKGLAQQSDMIDEHGRAVPDSVTLPKAVFVEIWTRLRDELTESPPFGSNPA